MKFIFLFIFILMGCDQNQDSYIFGLDSQFVIYGEEDRTEPLSSHHIPIELIRATVQIREKKEVPLKLKEAYHLCSNESYLDQETIGFCSGVLINEKQILTAGHCLIGLKCENLEIAFDRYIGSPEVIVNHCQRIIYQQNNSRGDYAIIELNEDVKDRNPIAIAPAGLTPPKVLLSLSYPLGLPQKASWAKFKRNEINFLNYEVNTFEGSSGSPLFDPYQKTLWGVLSSGEEDFNEDDIYESQKSGKCLNTRRCAAGYCRGERFFDARLIFK